MIKLETNEHGISIYSSQKCLVKISIKPKTKLSAVKQTKYKTSKVKKIMATKETHTLRKARAKTCHRLLSQVYFGVLSLGQREFSPCQPNYTGAVCASLG